MSNVGTGIVICLSIHMDGYIFLTLFKGFKTINKK